MTARILPVADHPDEPTPLAPDAPALADSEALDAYSRVGIDVVQRLAPSVASLRVLRKTARGRVPAGAGSGVVLTPDGFLLTSAHVVPHRSCRIQRRARDRLPGPRHRPFLRSRSTPSRRRRPDTHRAGRRSTAARRTARRRDRQPPRLRRLSHSRSRLRPRPIPARAVWPRTPDDRQRDSNRRRAQSRELWRSSRRLDRPARRDQHRRRRNWTRARRANQ
jgi:hypothetical protein